VVISAAHANSAAHASKNSSASTSTTCPDFSRKEIFMSSFSRRSYGRISPSGRNRRPAVVICPSCDGPTVAAAVDAGTEIAVGDLLYQDTDDARPASALPDEGSEAANQAAFHDFFLGAATTAKPAGSAGTVIAQVAGRRTFSCASQTFELGQLVGPNENGGGTALLNQEVTPVASATLAIGRVSRRYAVATTTVEVDMVSTVMYGGPMPL